MEIDKLFNDFFAFLCLGLGAWLLYYVVHGLFFHPLSRHPGPKLAAISTLPFVYYTFLGRVIYWTESLHEQYGKVVRIKPNELSFITETAWKDIYQHRHGFQDFQKVTQIQPPNGCPPIFSADDVSHARQRKILAHAFSERALKQQEPLLQSYVDLLISILHSKINVEKPVVDLVEWYNYAFFDIVGELTYGQPFQNLQNQADHPWITSFMGGLKLAVRLIHIGSFIPLEFVVEWVSPKSFMAERMAMFEFTQIRVSERFAIKTDKPDIMSYIIRYNSDDGSKGLISRDEIDSTLADLIIAGSETSATTLSSATYYLTKNPVTLRRLKNEVRGSFRTEGEITVASASKLPYLLAVLDESLRLHPPVPATLPRFVPSGGATVSGYWLPGGVVVGVPQYTAFRSPLHFADPTSFRPERFIQSHDPKYDKDCQDIFQPFSFGPRNCIGRTLAYAQMSLLLAKMVYNFDMELMDQEHDWAKQDCWILWQKTPLNIRLSPRT